MCRAAAEPGPLPRAGGRCRPGLALHRRVGFVTNTSHVPGCAEARTTMSCLTRMLALTVAELSAARIPASPSRWPRPRAFPPAAVDSRWAASGPTSPRATTLWILPPCRAAATCWRTGAGGPKSRARNASTERPDRRGHAATAEQPGARLASRPRTVKESAAGRKQADLARTQRTLSRWGWSRRGWRSRLLGHQRRRLLRRQHSARQSGLRNPPPSANSPADAVDLHSSAALVAVFRRMNQRTSRAGRCSWR